MVNVHQKGGNPQNTENQVIVPRSNFSCNGRVTGYLISLDQLSSDSGDYPSIQVWRPSDLTNYNEISRYTLTQNDISDMNSYYLASVSFTGANRIEFQSGDVIGYHLPNTLRYTIWNIETRGYTSFSISADNPLSSFDTDNDDSNEDSNRQPLILVLYGKATGDLCSLEYLLQFNCGGFVFNDQKVYCCQQCINFLNDNILCCRNSM